jgi:hypothetical protein
VAGECILRIVGERLHPVVELRDVNAQVLRRLLLRDAALLDQPNCLKLELACELPTLLHGPPPAPLNTLTRCLRNRVQATHSGEQLRQTLVHSQANQPQIQRYFHVASFASDATLFTRASSQGLVERDRVLLCCTLSAQGLLVRSEAVLTS